MTRRRDSIVCCLWICIVSLIIALAFAKDSKETKLLTKNGVEINCRIHTFAPICRGVAAKRNEYPPLRNQPYMVGPGSIEWQYGVNGIPRTMSRKKQQNRRLRQMISDLISGRRNVFSALA